ncbi:hypothetical protein MY5147_002270 [Beauveria neobassiana]
MNLALYSVLRLHIGIEDPCWETLYEVSGISFEMRHNSILVELG